MTQTENSKPDEKKTQLLEEICEEDVPVVVEN